MRKPFLLLKSLISLRLRPFYTIMSKLEVFIMPTVVQAARNHNKLLLISYVYRADIIREKSYSHIKHKYTGGED